MSKFSAWMDKPASRWVVAVLAACVLANSISSGISLFKVSRTSAQAAAVSQQLRVDENRTCQIQQNGLPASHTLVKVIGDIHFIINESLKLAGPHPPALQKLSPKEAFNVIWVYKDLSRASQHYKQLERAQPNTRQC